jgi:hypothetical protein
VVREGVGLGGEMTQALYAHMNNKKKKEKKKIFLGFGEDKRSDREEFRSSEASNSQKEKKEFWVILFCVSVLGSWKDTMEVRE